MTLAEDQNIFLVTFEIFRNKQIIRKNVLKLTPITFKDEYEWIRRFSQQYENHC